MKDKEKQIEEMAKDIQNAVNGCAKYWAEVIAKYLTEQDYRKLPKDSVVLSREEYESLYTQEQYDKVYEQAENDILANMSDGGTSCHWCIEQHEKKASKETAEKFAKAVKDRIKWLQKWYNEEIIDTSYNGITTNEIDEILIQFSAEIKEN